LGGRAGELSSVRIQVLSDLHLEAEPFVPREVGADVVVLAGDIHNGATGIDWAKQAFRVPVLYLAGNHEYYDGEFEEVRSAMSASARDSTVDLLDCSERVLDGVRFLGCTLWTDFSLAPDSARPEVMEQARTTNPDYDKIRYGARRFTPEDGIALCRKHRSWIERKLGQPFPGATVAITHFAPHPNSIAAAYVGHPANSGFIVDLEALMGRAALWIHGHTHSGFDYVVRGTRVVCNPRGYPEEFTGFRPDWTVEL
jgi:predicted phosphodiesterase